MITALLLLGMMATAAPDLLELKREYLSLLQEKQTRHAERSLRAFIRQAWPVVEPSTPFVPGWHLDAISDHLEAVTRGQIRNLVINMPPRHSKSLEVAVFWPVWEWIAAPERRWLFSSYALSLSIRDSVKCRRMIESQWYQQRWGHVYQLTSDQNVKARFENNQTGYRIATSVGGSATGEGGDRIVVDDPHNVQESESETIRASTLSWWDEVMSTRLNDPRTGAKVIVMQRCHEDDLAGHVLAQGGYELLCLPAEFDGRKTVTSIGWVDPRTEDGELLWPERFGHAELASLKTAMGSYAAAGQLQQRPAPREGGLFQRNWLPLVATMAPIGAKRVRYWDKAGSEGKGDYTAGVLMAMHEHVYYVEDVVRGQWSSGQRNLIMQQIAAKDGTAVQVYVEQEPGSGGKESADITVRQLAGYSVKADPVTGDKVTRARPLAAQAEGHNVRLVQGTWNTAAFIDELTIFPNGSHDDQVDAAAGAFNKLTLDRRGGRVIAWP